MIQSKYFVPVHVYTANVLLYFNAIYYSVIYLDISITISF